jgi:hypothetical protein
MARKSGWRLVCPEQVKGRQLLAIFGGSRLFLLRQSGPAAYTLQEEGRKKPLQVCELNRSQLNLVFEF